MAKQKLEQDQMQVVQFGIASQQLLKPQLIQEVQKSTPFKIQIRTQQTGFFNNTQINIQKRKKNTLFFNQVKISYPLRGRVKAQTRRIVLEDYFKIERKISQETKDSGKIVQAENGVQAVQSEKLSQNSQKCLRRRDFSEISNAIKKEFQNLDQ